MSLIKYKKLVSQYFHSISDKNISKKEGERKSIKMVNEFKKELKRIDKENGW